MTPRRPEPPVIRLTPAIPVTPTTQRWRSVAIHPYLYVALGSAAAVRDDPGLQGDRLLDDLRAGNRVR